jgi:hypothetical protein
VVSSKWLYKIKHVVDESIEKHKARFVSRGFYPKEGIDYEETFVPVVGILVVGIDVNPSHGFWTARLMKVFGHEGK